MCVAGGGSAVESFNDKKDEAIATADTVRSEGTAVVDRVRQENTTAGEKVRKGLLPEPQTFDPQDAADTITGLPGTIEQGTDTLTEGLTQAGTDVIGAGMSTQAGVGAGAAGINQAVQDALLPRQRMRAESPGAAQSKGGGASRRGRGTLLTGRRPLNTPAASGPKTLLGA